MRIGIKSGIYSAVKNVCQNKKVFAKTTAERNEERGNVLRHQNTFLIANYAEPGEVNFDIFRTWGNLLEKIAIYCPQGSGTLRQQLLMMH